MSHRRIPVFWLVTGAVVVMGLAYAFWPRPVAVDVGRVTRGPMQLSVDEDGRTRVHDRYVVSAPVAGRVRRIMLRPGDSIQAGKTILAVIEPTDPAPLDARERAGAEARLRAAEATFEKSGPDLQRAQTAHEYAVEELKRMQESFASHSTSHQALDSAEERERSTAQEILAAQFARQIAQFEMEQARSVLTQRGSTTTSPAEWLMEIPAPVDGKVLRVFQESSAVVAAGSRLVEAGDLRSLEVEVDVLSSDGAHIAPGTRVILDGWGGPTPLSGRVRLVEPSAFTKVSALGVEEQRVNVIIDIIDPPEARPSLGDGFRVDAHIVTWEATDVQKLPAGALFPAGNGWAVFAISEGKARLRPVKVGRQNAAEAEIVEKIEDDLQVVLFPGDKISDGVKVSPRLANGRN